MVVKMPGDLKECRQHAQTSWALAAHATSPELKAHFANMAQRWERLSYDLEGMEKLYPFGATSAQA
jgi:hypothetical protein